VTEPQRCEVSVVIPCLDEAETLGVVIRHAQESLARLDPGGEVIVADNGSTDGSQEIARSLGARVVDVPVRGYGAALMGGIEAARGRYVVMGDADDSYALEALDPFVEELRRGTQLVMGNRFRGGIEPGAMPPLHRYLGNPVLSFIGRLFFRNDIGDFHCGLRAFDRDAVLALDLRTTGMEFASELVVKASLFGLSIGEVPTILRKDGRSRPPHLRTWRDGWRHLRFLLIYSPRWLFLYPGLVAFVVGLLTSLWLLPSSRYVRGAELDLQALVFTTLAMLLGAQALWFAVLAKSVAIAEGLLPEDPRLERFLRFATLERIMLVGGIVAFVGILGLVLAIVHWAQAGFGPLDIESSLRTTLVASSLAFLGIQAVLSGFLLSLLRMRVRAGGHLHRAAAHPG
jgi:glycosyltransferase involved in cell wall biosynthesis